MKRLSGQALYEITKRRTEMVEVKDSTRVLEGEVLSPFSQEVYHPKIEAFKPRTADAENIISNALKILTQQALENTKLIADDAIDTIQSIIESIDGKLEAQINAILHDKKFQELEGTWRGLHHLVNNSETGERLKIKVLNIKKEEVDGILKKSKGAAWDQSLLFKKIYGEEYDQYGGDPFGCLIGDYEFNHSSSDIDFLTGIAEISQAAHVPFIAAASPALLDMDTWQELADKDDLSATFERTDHIKWRSLRENDATKYIGLTLPHFLARLPYGPDTLPVSEFDFKEDVSGVDGVDHSRYVWSNSAYAMGVNINRAFTLYGWCAKIAGVNSGGTVEDLSVHTFKVDDRGLDMKCPTEVAIGNRQWNELSTLGFIPLVHKKNTDKAVFFSAQSIRKPDEFAHDPDKTADAKLRVKLPYIFAASRFAHYLRAILIEEIHQQKEGKQIQEELAKWINHYVLSNPEAASEIDKAKKPLAAAQVKVKDDPSNPGYYEASFELRPHFHLEALKANLSLVSKVSKNKI